MTGQRRLHKQVLQVRAEYGNSLFFCLFRHGLTQFTFQRREQQALVGIAHRISHIRRKHVGRTGHHLRNRRYIGIFRRLQRHLQGPCLFGAVYRQNTVRRHALNRFFIVIIVQIELAQFFVFAGQFRSQNAILPQTVAQQGTHIGAVANVFGNNIHRPLQRISCGRHFIGNKRRCRFFCRSDVSLRC